MTPALISDLILCNTVFVNSAVKGFQSRYSGIWLKRLPQILCKWDRFLDVFGDLGSKKERKICVFEVWLSVLTGALFLCGWPCAIQRFFLIINGLLASCVWSLKLCPKWEIISLFTTSASRCRTTSDLFSKLNDFTADCMYGLVLHQSSAIKLHFQKLNTWPLTFFFASIFFFFCWYCSAWSFFFVLWWAQTDDVSRGPRLADTTYFKGQHRREVEKHEGCFPTGVHFRPLFLLSPVDLRGILTRAHIRHSFEVLFFVLLSKPELRRQHQKLNHWLADMPLVLLWTKLAQWPVWYSGTVTWLRCIIKHTE